MPVERAPASPLPPGFRPPGARAYRVRDGDDWASVVRHTSLPIWGLIRYNFGTSNPSEVNWYLRHRVGCTRTTKDKCNYLFSSSDNPGLIYFPAGLQTTVLLNGALVEISGPTDYKLHLQSTLRWITSSESGQALLKAIARTRKRLVIKPLVLPTACTINTVNAYASADDVRAATASGEHYQLNDDSNTPRDERFDALPDPGFANAVRGLVGLPLKPLVGTGTGSSATIQFSPEMFGFRSTCGLPGGQPGSSPSQILFHEMVHAYRIMAGRLNKLPTVGSSRGYSNTEEFLAILLTNIFSTDSSNPASRGGLRMDHRGFSQLAYPLNNSSGFAANAANKHRIQQVMREEPELVSSFKGIRSSFNPFSLF